MMINVSKMKKSLLLCISLGLIASEANAYPPKINPNDPNARQLYVGFTPTWQGLIGNFDPNNMIRIDLPVKLSNLKNEEEWIRWREEKEIYAGVLPIIPSALLTDGINSVASMTPLLPGLVGAPGIFGSGAVGYGIGSLATAVPAAVVGGTLAAAGASLGLGSLASGGSNPLSSWASTASAASIPVDAIGSAAVAAPSLAVSVPAGIAGAAVASSPNLTSFASLAAPALSPSYNVGSGTIGGMLDGFASYVAFSELFVD